MHLSWFHLKPLNAQSLVVFAAIVVAPDAFMRMRYSACTVSAAVGIKSVTAVSAIRATLPAEDPHGVEHVSVQSPNIDDSRSYV